ncbi:hypothetical protein [Bacillus cereus]|uniref:hypothetical protein n=1 Tax=Bacillus cereus TaxID=1396 RepID=UPI00159B96DC|nr:hypothetical protein [Bacillus cereus]
MDIVWSDILVGVLSSAGGAGIATHYVKKRIEKKLNEQLADYNSALQKLNTNYQIVFSKLHGDRTETIKQLYNILFEVDRNVRNLKWEEERANIEGIREEISKLMRKATELNDNYQVNRIYFSEDICELFESMNAKLRDVILPINYYYFERFHVSLENQGSETEIKEKMRKYMDEDIPELKGKIEEEFKKILGVNEK